MKYILMMIVALALPVCAAADVTGKWSGSFEFNQDGENHSEPAYLILKQDGASLTGTAGPNEEKQMPIRNGKVDGDKVTFEVALEHGSISFSLLIAEDSMTGDMSAPEKEEGPRSAKLSVKRVKEQ